MNRARRLSFVTTAIALLHIFPARKHLAAFVGSPSLDEAWKGFGAVAAIVLLLLPHAAQLRLLRAMWRNRVLTALISGALVCIHLVPATDHLPKLVAALAWGDAWRGLGSLCAVLWFAMPFPLQGRVLHRVLQIELRSRDRSAQLRTLPSHG